MTAAQQSTKELDLVDAVPGKVKGIGGRAEIDGWRDADDSLQLRRSGRPEFARELEDEIAAHGIADQRNGFEAVKRDEVTHDRADIGGETGVVESRCEGLRAAAVPHVHADDIALVNDLQRAGARYQGPAHRLGPCWQVVVPTSMQVLDAPDDDAGANLPAVGGAAP